MIKIQKKNFNLEEEIEKIKNKHSDIGALTSFVGYVRAVSYTHLTLPTKA